MEAVQPPKVSRTFFVRDATGLVRELSWFDTFLCGLGILNVALGLVQAFAYAPFVFPGSSMAIAFLIALPGAFFIGLLNALFTAAMPRSGGDYVWVSHSLSPVVGFAVNFFATFGVIAAAAVNIWYMASNFLAPTLYILGFQSAASWVDVSGLLILNDVDTGFPLAVMDYTWITGYRTGAASALSARYLARPDSSTAAILACGVQGRTHLEALASEFPLQPRLRLRHAERDAGPLRT